MNLTLHSTFTYSLRVNNNGWLQVSNAPCPRGVHWREASCWPGTPPWPLLKAIFRTPERQPCSPDMSTRCKLSMVALMQLTSFDWEWSYHYIMHKRDVHACFATASWACIVTLSCENEPNERALHWQKRESSILFGASHQYLQQTVNKLRSICSWLDNIWTLVGVCFKLLRTDLWEH